MKQPGDWVELDLSGDPILVVGRRPRARVLEGFAVDLHQETFATMREIAEVTVAQLSGREVLPWHPYADMTAGEQYLSADLAELPSPPPSGHRGASDGASAPPESPFAAAADLVRLVLEPGALDDLHPSELAEGAFRFYAIVWESADGGAPIAFVSEYDPTVVLRKASSYFRFDGTLRSAPRPDFALDDRADLVVTSAEVAILNPTSFDRLFSDIRALLNDVPSYAASLKTAMVALPMSAATEAAIVQACVGKPSLARQLWNLATSPTVGTITPAALRAVLTRHGQTAADFIKSGTLEIDAEQVSVVLDVAEGRWYEADFTSEPRRAARWSRR